MQPSTQIEFPCEIAWCAIGVLASSDEWTNQNGQQHFVLQNWPKPRDFHLVTWVFVSLFYTVFS
jgi:hypothetical protein